MNADKEHEAFGLVIEHQKSRASENDILDQPNPEPLRLRKPRRGVAQWLSPPPII